MKRYLLNVTFGGLVAAFLVSCSATAAPVMTPAPALEKTPTVQPSPSATMTNVVPSKTPQPTKIPTSTPVAILPAYDLPAWMRRPDTAILASLTASETQKTQNLVFYNAASGESFKMPLPDVGRYFWYDNANFGLMTKNLKKVYRLNLPSGMVTLETVSESSTRLLTEEGAALQVIQDPANSGEILFDTLRQGNNSKNKSFRAAWDDEYKTLSVTDTRTGQVVWQSEPVANVYGTEFIWSPVDDGQLAYLTGSPEPLNGDITLSMKLTIVDVVRGKVLSTYAGDFGVISWAPDGKKILYLDPWFRYRNYGVGFQGAPCLLMLETGEKRCLRAIPRQVPPGRSLVTTGVYTWETDSQSLYFTYVYTTPDLNKSMGELCSYSLVDSHIDCPTQGLDILQTNTILGYELSPDRKYIRFCYSAASILNDYADTSRDALVGVNGTGFFDWIGFFPDGGPPRCSAADLWRPLP